MAIAQFTPRPELRRLMARHGVDPRYRRRARARLRAATLFEPLRALESLCYGRRLREAAIHPEPLFLLGYGRSGTTHLHNLLWQDAQFAVVTNYQAATQPFALVGRAILPRLLAGRMPRTRPMDDVAITLDAPQEEEVALLNLTEHAPLHFMSFPRALPGLYDDYVAGLGRDAKRRDGFAEAWLSVLRKATLLGGGRRLVLKTPTHTARIPFLLETFPEARFAHIVRDPYPVYQSMRNMYRKILPRETLQELDWDAIDAWTRDAYVQVMARYLEDRKRIAPGRLFELRYEDLEAEPLAVLERLYEALGLPGFEGARSAFERYLSGLGGFRKNRFDYPAEVVETVNRHWGFALDAFGYERRPPDARAARP